MSGAASLPVRLEALFGADRVRAGESDLAEYAIDGIQPLAVLRPASAEEVTEIVRVAVREKFTVIPFGAGSKLGIGMPPQRHDIAIDMRGLCEIAHYDPDDLTLSVDSGRTLGSLKVALQAKGQFLPLSVPCIEICTIGGTVASGIDSSLRQQYGTARDFLIGAEFVDGTGRLCKSGGRVVKNVTGYDIHKLLIGSLGTLSVITRLSFRTFPLPEAHGGHLAAFPKVESALQYHAEVSKSGLPLSNLELFDPEYAAMARRFLEAINQDAGNHFSPGHWVVYAACDAVPAVVKRMLHDLEQLASSSHCTNQMALEDPTGDGLQDLSQVAYQWVSSADRSVVLLRIVLPQIGAATIRDILSAAEAPLWRTVFVLRACNVAYLGLITEKDDASTLDALGRCGSSVFATVAAKSGSASVLHAPTTVNINVWGAQRPDFPLMQRVKAAFDPQNVFAPGRFVGGI